MQAHYAFAFEREMGCTEAELRGWLPGASRQRPITWHADGAELALDGGAVSITWQRAEPRRIALIVLPRLQVRFEARGIDAAAWQSFMHYFDQYTHRGGG